MFAVFIQDGAFDQVSLLLDIGSWTPLTGLRKGHRFSLRQRSPFSRKTWSGGCSNYTSIENWARLEEFQGLLKGGKW